MKFINFTKSLRNRGMLLFSVILSINIILRLIFIVYGYITTDEGIALYNAKLAYSGHIPFIDYNGWNSLLTDYLIGFSSLFTLPTIFSQRVIGFLIALIVLILCLIISRTLGSGKQVLLTGLFLTFGSITYLYNSNIPYSSQIMSLFLILTIFCISKSLKSKRHILHWNSAAIMFAVINTAVRSQTIPILLLCWFYTLYRHRQNRNYLIKVTGIGLLTATCVYLPFLFKSVQLTLYALIWPFFSKKILIYVSDIPRYNLTNIIEFIILTIRDYGIFLIIILSEILFTKTVTSKKNYLFSLFCRMIIFIYLLTALIHHPMDSSYLYPVVPLLSIMASNYVIITSQKISGVSTRKFLYALLIFILFSNFVAFPHYKFLKTSLSTIQKNPHDYVREISAFVENNTNIDDLIITFYLPVVAEINRSVPIRMNEGAGSLSILDTQSAQKYHLTSLEEFKDMIHNKRIAMIIYNDSYTHYFGRTELQRLEILNEIKKNYSLIKEFSESNLSDGARTKSLYLYSLSK